MSIPQPAGYRPKLYVSEHQSTTLVAAFLISLAVNGLVLWLAVMSFRQHTSLLPLLLGDTINVLALGYGLWRKQRALAAGIALGYLLTFFCSLLLFHS
jgi:hypothetical protein